jgi:hypothetical protein
MAAVGDTLLNSLKYATIVVFAVAIGMVLGKPMPW